MVDYHKACICAVAVCLCVQVSFVAAINTRLADGSHMMVLVDQLGRLVQTPAGPDGTLTAYNPMEGSSTFPPAPSSSVHAAGSGPALQQEL